MRLPWVEDFTAMKVIWAAALVLAVCSAEAFSEQGTLNPYADEWSCDYKSNGKTFTQKWTVANGRMTGQSGKGGLRVILNDDRVLIGFFRIRQKSDDEPVLGLTIIDKKSGDYFDIDTVVMSTMGKPYDDTSEPGVQIGALHLLQR
jgi:hypothetical protein